MNGEPKKAYAEIINKVYEYINEHLDDDLSVDKLSEVANFSKYHFHRQFAEYTGMNVAKCILMLRLKRASYQLVFNAQYRIIDIALMASFESPESFSRTFKATFGQTPTQFRKSPEWKSWNDNYLLPAIERNVIMKIEIVNFAETSIAASRHTGFVE